MFQLLTILKNIDLKNTAIIVLIVAIFIQWKTLDNRGKELEAAKAIAENPKTVEVFKQVLVKGPIRTVTKIVEKPNGERETLISQINELEQVILDYEKNSQPVPIEEILAVKKEHVDRWLVGVDLRTGQPTMGHAATYYVGRSFINRLDVMVGFAKPESGFESHIFTAVRF